MIVECMHVNERKSVHRPFNRAKKIHFRYCVVTSLHARQTLQKRVEHQFSRVQLRTVRWEVNHQHAELFEQRLLQTDVVTLHVNGAIVNNEYIAIDQRSVFNETTHKQ